MVIQILIVEMRDPAGARQARSERMPRRKHFVQLAFAVLTTAGSTRKRRGEDRKALGARARLTLRGGAATPFVMPLDFVVSALVTLLVVVDPISLVPSFLAVTPHLSHAQRWRIAVRACIIAGAILAGFALGGAWLLAVLGITIPAFRIAG